MHRLIVAGVGVIVLSIVLVSSDAPVGAANNAAEVPSIEDIMKLVNKPKGLHKAVGKALDQDTVDWASVSKMTKQYAELAGDLGKNKCEKGTAQSWDKLCKLYAADAKALNAAAVKKDKPAAEMAFKKLSKSCQGCHDEHR